MEEARLQVTTNEEDGIFVCEISGEGDSSNSEHIFEGMSALFGKTPKMMIDLKGLVFCNSRFIGRLLGLAEEVMEKGGRICLSGCHPNVYDTLDVVGFFGVFPLFPGKDLARNYLCSTVYADPDRRQ